MSNELTNYEKIIQKFKQLKQDASSDCIFELNELDNSFNNTNLLVKWITRKTDWSSAYRTLEVQRKKQYRDLYEFYCTDYPRKLSSKEEYALFIESDENYNSIFQQCLLVKEIIQFCDSTIETLKARGFMIKNAIDWLRFKSGQ